MKISSPVVVPCRLFTEANYSITSNSVLTPRINSSNWTVSVISVSLTANENHLKFFALSFNWLPMSSILLTIVHDLINSSSVNGFSFVAIINELFVI